MRKKDELVATNEGSRWCLYGGPPLHLGAASGGASVAPRVAATGHCSVHLSRSSPAGRYRAPRPTRYTGPRRHLNSRRASSGACRVPLPPSWIASKKLLRLTARPPRTFAALPRAVFASYSPLCFYYRVPLHPLSTLSGSSWCRARRRTASTSSASVRPSTSRLKRPVVTCTEQNSSSLQPTIRTDVRPASPSAGLRTLSSGYRASPPLWDRRAAATCTSSRASPATDTSPSSQGLGDSFERTPNQTSTLIRTSYVLRDKARAILAFLGHFDWRRFGIVYRDRNVYYESLFNELSELAEGLNMSITCKRHFLPQRED
ncbi:hypothetical protein MRX96_056305 [Rhipicephalus microplus]